ncbi:type 2 lanthipeptide synthetase LanM family protein [Dyella sp. GSA-30]|uniref:type 2 lanthipeptide synthetase LanM family protein n=1 Tax=Dyella sp. GSA-30 TaxID=2994496 RepID=UPI0024939964|nr:type 2 lanthipeptide synthetase LanM family protein [Dyella sp. GSA-30]BDU19175.1 lanthionine synthetase [Dyella sp. GSA-30]
MADTHDDTDAFGDIIACFTEPHRDVLAARLTAWSPQLDDSERDLIGRMADAALHTHARLKLNRVLLLELHAAKLEGLLTANDESARFAQFVELACKPAFVTHLDTRYPVLRSRLYRMLDRQRHAIEAMTERFIADRDALTTLLGKPTGRLLALTMGEGDLHAGGQAVARLTVEGGQIMYKPRSLRIDHVLENLLDAVFDDDPDRIRIPPVIDRGDYGWAAFVPHRYCDGNDELRAFYHRMGDWLGILRLVGGTDIHHENLIAVGPTPTVIDAESLFALLPKVPSSPYGHAHELAQGLIRSSVLRTGIVPFRAPALGFDGVDVSAAGALPDQQPQLQVPVIVNAGTTEARLDIVDIDVEHSQNHPDPRPDVSLYWDRISEGFLDTSRRLRHLDATGQLAPMLDAFEGCIARDILRPTQAYVELGRMLWHPASLHDEAPGIERARDLLARNAIVMPIAPSSPEAIAAEIDDLRHGDIPVFSAPLTRARIDGALADWRGMRIDLEELTIRSALVITSLNQRFAASPAARDFYPRHPHSDHLETRRRQLLTDATERLLRLSVRGNDGSVTWITPETCQDGWMVQPLQSDVYFGMGGVVIALAGYRHEVQLDRADPVPGLDETLEGALQTLQALEQDKPRTFGGFTGYGARIWTWLTLYDLLPRAAWISRAAAVAQALESEGFEQDTLFDILDGASGVIVPLLRLAELTGQPRWLALAANAGKHLEKFAILDEQGRASWITANSDRSIGGFAHGAAGIGWSLARLALSDAGSAIDRARWQSLAKATEAFQNSLYDPASGNWYDLRHGDNKPGYHTWCNGSVGIGLAASDLYARTRDPRHLHTVRQALRACESMWGITHTLCHGDFSLWEFHSRATALDPTAAALDRDAAVAQVVSSIEENRGVIGGMTRAAFTPGLMTGLAGAVHGLSRMHPECRLGSPLLLEASA